MDTDKDSKERADLEIRYPDGTVVYIEVKSRHGHDVVVTAREATDQVAMHVRAANAASVGAASVFGWYVRSAAPWSEDADTAAIRSDWRVVGDDLWRAAARLGDAELVRSPK